MVGGQEQQFITEDVSGIVGHLVLQDRGDALHAHARVHMLGWQALQAAICLPVELHTHCLVGCEKQSGLLERQSGLL